MARSRVRERPDGRHPCSAPPSGDGRWAAARRRLALFSRRRSGRSARDSSISGLADLSRHRPAELRRTGDACSTRHCSDGHAWRRPRHAAASARLAAENPVSAARNARLRTPPSRHRPLQQPKPPSTPAAPLAASTARRRRRGAAGASVTRTGRRLRRPRPRASRRMRRRPRPTHPSRARGATSGACCCAPRPPRTAAT